MLLEIRGTTLRVFLLLATKPNLEGNYFLEIALVLRAIGSAVISLDLLVSLNLLRVLFLNLRKTTLGIVIIMFGLWCCLVCVFLISDIIILGKPYI